MPAPSSADGQVQRGGRFARPALLVAEHDDPRARGKRSSRRGLRSGLRRGGRNRLGGGAGGRIGQWISLARIVCDPPGRGQFLRVPAAKLAPGGLAWAGRGGMMWAHARRRPKPTHEALRRAFRWHVPDRYNIGVDCCDRHAGRHGRLRADLRRADGAVERYTFDDAEAAVEPPRQRARGLGCARGDRVGVLLPQRPETAIAHLAGYKLGLHRGAAVRAVRPGRARVPARRQRRRRPGHRRREPAEVARSATGCPTSRTILVVDGAGGRAPPICRRAADARLRRLRAGRHRGRRSGADHLHLGHDRPAEGRAARPSRPARPPARRASCRTSSSRSRATSSGRRPTGPGSAGCSTCCCRRCITACRCWRTASRKFDPEEAFALMARARRAQRLPAADGAEADAPGQAARPSRRSACAPSASGGETLGEEMLDWGRATLRRDDQRVLRPDRVQPGGRQLRGAVAGAARLDGPADSRATTSAIVDDDGQAACRPARPGHIAVRRPDPVMFLGYWNNPEATARKVRRRLAADRRRRAAGRRTATSGTWAARTT